MREMKAVERARNFFAFLFLVGFGGGLGSLVAAVWKGCWSELNVFLSALSSEVQMETNLRLLVWRPPSCHNDGLLEDG